MKEIPLADGAVLRVDTRSGDVVKITADGREVLLNEYLCLNAEHGIA